MRKLGAALGVEAMSLYHHFPSKGHVLDAVAERLLLEIELPQQGDWRARLAESARRYRGLALAHPRAFVLLTTRRAATERTLAFYERLFGISAEAGFDDVTIAHTFRLMGYYAGGAGLAEVASRGTGEDATPSPMERGPDANRFPLLAAAAPHLRAANLDAVFESGLALIMGALETLPRRRKD